MQDFAEIVFQNGKYFVKYEGVFFETNIHTAYFEFRKHQRLFNNKVYYTVYVEDINGNNSNILEF